MATPEQIRQTADRVGDSYSSLNSKNSNLKSAINKANSSWNSKIGDAFENSAKRCQTDIKDALSDLNKLKSKLNTLASKVQQAQRENNAKAKSTGGGGW